MTNDKDLSVTTFNTVVVQKTKLLATLEANRNKHDSIYAASVSGYWLEAQQVLEQKKTEFSDATKKLEGAFSRQKDEIQTFITDQNKDKIGGSFSLGLNFNSSWPLRFPENHTEDYNRVIDMLNFSVADKVELSAQDFNAYVRNDWSWRSSFLASNAGYVSRALTGSYVLYSGISGSMAPNICSGYTVGNVSVTGGTYTTMAVQNQLNSAF